jgi:phenylalanyl-tRNA synthetase beta chain
MTMWLIKNPFDYDVLVKRAQGVPRITVRPAKPGEVMTTLDGVTRSLTPERLLITDTAGPIAVAGVMGGAETEVTNATRTVLLESANFHFVSIRKTTQTLKLPSEASARFAGVCRQPVPAVMRATALMGAGGEDITLRGVADATCPARLPASHSILMFGALHGRSSGDIIRILTVGLRRAPDGDKGFATAPAHRLMWAKA